MYYLVEVAYVGVDHPNDHWVEIRTKPAVGNQSHQPIIHGWCGTTNNWSTYSHGSYVDLNSARQAIDELFDKYVEIDSDHPIDTICAIDENSIEQYRLSLYTKLGKEASVEWCYEGLKAEITAQTTDEQIQEIAEHNETEANSEGLSLDLNAVVWESQNIRREMSD